MFEYCILYLLDYDNEQLSVTDKESVDNAVGINQSESDEALCERLQWFVQMQYRKFLLVYSFLKSFRKINKWLALIVSS